MAAPTIRENWWDALQALEPGWDSYSGKRISYLAMQAAGLFYVVPCGDGGIQLETHQSGYDIEIVIGPDGKIKSALVCHEEKAGNDQNR